MVIEVRVAPILALLTGGETRSAALADAVGMPVRSMRRALARLRDDGLVELTGHDWTLTGAGRRAALAATVPEPAASLAVLDKLPAEHRAMLRLIEDAVVARRALREVYSSNWPGFVVVGPTKTGKTVVGSLAARRFGLDLDETVRLLQMETPGSLLARRVQTSADAWTSAPSPLLALPLIVLDEFDKAAPELRQAAFAYLAGAARYRSENVVLEVTATAIVTLNAERDAARLLPDAYLRRAVVLDTTPLRAIVRDLDLVAAQLARVVLPQVPVDLAPPAASLPDEARSGLRRLLLTCLSERGWTLVDMEAISRLVLGRWASMPADVVAAVASVAADYLLVITTREGLVRPDWDMRFKTVVNGADAPPVGTILAVAHARQVAREDRQAATARAELAAEMALAGERERMLGALDYAIASAPRGKDLTIPERATIDRARGVAKRLRVEVTEARSLTTLSDLDGPLEGEVRTPIATVESAVEARRTAADQDRTRQRQRDDDARRQAVEWDKAAQQVAKAEAQASKARRVKLQALCQRSAARAGESVVAALVDAGCLTPSVEQHEVETLGSLSSRALHQAKVAVRIGAAALAPRDSGIVAVIPPAPQPVYETRTETWYVDRAGHRYSAGELVAWRSAKVDAVLGAARTAEGLPLLTRPAPRRVAPRRV